MGDQQAKVTSLDAIEAFRSSAIIFATKARRAVDMATDEVRRTRTWVEGDRRLFWENEFRKRSRALERAQQEMMSARFSEFNESMTMQKAALRKKTPGSEAWTRPPKSCTSIKVWTRNFDGTFDPMVKRLDTLRFYLPQEARTCPRPSRLSFAECRRTLESYAEKLMSTRRSPSWMRCRRNCHCGASGRWRRSPSLISTKRHHAQSNFSLRLHFMSNVGASNLNQAFKDFHLAWQDAHVRIYWRDSVQKATEFEHKYLKELPAQIAQVKTVMEEMDLLLRKVRNDCE